MNLKGEVENLLSAVLEEFSYHPLIAPYLDTSRENPLQQYVHQWEVIGRLALRKPVRVLIGDEIGLGKTIIAIATAKYLEKFNRAEKILVIVPRVLVMQWRKELLRMGIPASKIRHLERTVIEFWKMQNFPKGYYIASMDLLKREERMEEAVNVPWDLIIVDEVHKFGYKTLRFWEIGKKLIEADPKRNIIFLSATPHRGDPRDYISRLQLLDPYLLEGWRSLDSRRFYETTHGAILFRRTKEDVNNIYEEREIFLPARFYAGVIKARKDEVEFVERLVEFLRSKLVEFAYERGLISQRVIPLLIILIFKRAASSPYSAWTTLERLLIKRAAPDFTNEIIDSVQSFLETGYEDYEYAEKDPEEVFDEFLDRASPLLTPRDKKEVAELRDMARSIIEKGDSKLEGLISLLEGVMAEEGSKIIVFTEYKDTLDYLLKKIIERHPEWSKSILKLSSDETRDDKVFQKIRHSFEKNPRSRILMATDVVAEGVNLQVAHILINYEIPWSLIKLEQRIGRVWRLGQRKEVEAYTLFMNNVADSAALNSMYRKLLSLKRAKLSPRPVTGQEILLYAETQDLMKLPSPIAVVKEKRKKKFIRVTEGRSILTYLREGAAGLERLIASIIAARKEIERELTSKEILYKPKTKEEVEQSTKLTGFRNPSELFGSFKKLVEVSDEILGYRVFQGEPLRITKGLEMPTTIRTIDDIYGVLFKESIKNKPPSLVAYGSSQDTCSLIPVQVRDRRDGTVLYKELLGIDVSKEKIYRGPDLLALICEAVSNVFGIIEHEEVGTDIPFMLKVSLVETVRKKALELLNPVTYYANRLERVNLRDIERTWIKPQDLEVTFLDPVGNIHFVKTPVSKPEEIPEEVKKEIEEKAVEIVMEIEKAEGRIPKRVPDKEHYDIRSVNPSTGEVRIIEVKGHKDLDVYGELTNREAKLAERERDRYWLYIVYDIGSGEPKHLRFRDPLQTMNWRIYEKIERKKRYYLWPKRQEEDEETG